MELEELSQALKQTAAQLDDFAKKQKSKAALNQPNNM